MADVEFEEQSFETQERKIISKNRSAMAEWLMNAGVVENEKAATGVLIGLSVLFFLVSFLILFLGASKSSPDTYLENVRTLESINEN
jgi:hypothetical protein